MIHYLQTFSVWLVQDKTEGGRGHYYAYFRACNARRAYIHARRALALPLAFPAHTRRRRRAPHMTVTRTPTRHLYAQLRATPYTAARLYAYFPRCGGTAAPARRAFAISRARVLGASLVHLLLALTYIPAPLTFPSYPSCFLCALTFAPRLRLLHFLPSPVPAHTIPKPLVPCLPACLIPLLYAFCSELLPLLCHGTFPSFLLLLFPSQPLFLFPWHSASLASMPHRPLIPTTTAVMRHYPSHGLTFLLYLPCF